MAHHHDDPLDAAGRHDSLHDHRGGAASAEIFYGYVREVLVPFALADEVGSLGLEADYDSEIAVAAEHAEGVGEEFFGSEVVGLFEVLFDDGDAGDARQSVKCAGRYWEPVLIGEGIFASGSCPTRRGDVTSILCRRRRERFLNASVMVV